MLDRNRSVTTTSMCLYSIVCWSEACAQQKVDLTAASLTGFNIAADGCVLFPLQLQDQSGTQTMSWIIIVKQSHSAIGLQQLSFEGGLHKECTPCLHLADRLQA